MACCDTHDRMDLVLHSEEYMDFPCGTPTKPRGEPRYCCRACPKHGQPLELKAVFASNPEMMMHLTPEERARVLQMALAAGDTHVQVVSAVPPPVDNAVPEQKVVEP